MTTTYTESPWYYCISRNGESEFEIHADHCQIGTVERWNGDEGAEVMAEAEANACLVAAAPELFEALRLLTRETEARAGCPN